MYLDLKLWFQIIILKKANFWIILLHFKQKTEKRTAAHNLIYYPENRWQFSHSKGWIIEKAIIQHLSMQVFNETNWWYINEGSTSDPSSDEWKCPIHCKKQMSSYLQNSLSSHCKPATASTLHSFSPFSPATLATANIHGMDRFWSCVLQ